MNHEKKKTACCPIFSFRPCDSPVKMPTHMKHNWAGEWRTKYCSESQPAQVLTRPFSSQVWELDFWIWNRESSSGHNQHIYELYLGRRDSLFFHDLRTLHWILNLVIALNLGGFTYMSTSQIFILCMPRWLSIRTDLKVELSKLSKSAAHTGQYMMSDSCCDRQKRTAWSTGLYWTQHTFVYCIY